MKTIQPQDIKFGMLLRIHYKDKSKAQYAGAFWQCRNPRGVLHDLVKITDDGGVVMGIWQLLESDLPNIEAIERIESVPDSFTLRVQSWAAGIAESVAQNKVPG